MKKMFPFRFGAAGVARSASAIARSLKRGLRASALALRATPSAALRWLRDFLLMPQPPLLCEEGNSSQPHAYCLTWFPKYLLFSSQMYSINSSPASKVSGTVTDQGLV